LGWGKKFLTTIFSSKGPLRGGGGGWQWGCFVWFKYMVASFVGGGWGDHPRFFSQPPPPNGILPKMPPFVDNLIGWGRSNTEPVLSFKLNKQPHPFLNYFRAWAISFFGLVLVDPLFWGLFFCDTLVHPASVPPQHPSPPDQTKNTPRLDLYPPPPPNSSL